MYIFIRLISGMDVRNSLEHNMVIITGNVKAVIQNQYIAE